MAELQRQLATAGAGNWEAVVKLIQQALAGSDVQQGRAWNMSALPYSTGGRIEVTKNCFAFTFTNIGDTLAFVNEEPVFPSATPLLSVGDSVSVSAHVLDLYKGKIVLKFQPPIGANPKVIITQLFYMEGQGLKTTL